MSHLNKFMETLFNGPHTVRFLAMDQAEAAFNEGVRGEYRCIEIQGPKRRTLASAEEIAQHYATRADDWGTLVGPVRFTSFDGGAVSSNYGYRAQADRADVVAAEGRVLVYLSRVTARTAPHGRGECADRLLALGVARDVFSSGLRTVVAPCPQDAREAACGG